jgi:hypothetical protein
MVYDRLYMRQYSTLHSLDISARLVALSDMSNHVTTTNQPVRDILLCWSCLRSNSQREWIIYPFACMRVGCPFASRVIPPLFMPPARPCTRNGRATSDHMEKVTFLPCVVYSSKSHPYLRRSFTKRRGARRVPISRLPPPTFRNN